MSRLGAPFFWRTGSHLKALRGTAIIIIIIIIRKEPTISTTAANQARKETSEFNHKAALVLAERGMPREAIAPTLDIAVRTVRLFLNTPCPAYEQERAEVRKRRQWEHLQRTQRGKVPFLLELSLVNVLDEDEAVWLGDGWKGRRTREKVKFYVQQGIPQAKMARLLGVSRQAVSKHVRNLAGMIAA